MYIRPSVFLRDVCFKFKITYITRSIRHCEPLHAACSNFTFPFTRCRYCRHHYQDEPKPAIAIAIAQAACDSSDTW